MWFNVKQNDPFASPSLIFTPEIPPKLAGWGPGIKLLNSANTQFNLISKVCGHASFEDGLCTSPSSAIRSQAEFDSRVEVPGMGVCCRRWWWLWSLAQEATKPQRDALTCWRQRRLRALMGYRRPGLVRTWETGGGGYCWGQPKRFFFWLFSASNSPNAL